MKALLLEGARDADIPIIYTKINNRHVHAFSSLSAKKKEVDPTSPDTGNQIHPNLEPHNDDIVIEKHRASAFFDTHLGSILRRFGHEVRGCDIVDDVITEMQQNR